MGLGGKTILITRSKEQSSEFARSIELQGGQPVVFPATRIEDPESWKECDEAIR
jgi:uroporphyrinogen III methyltransferase/synthase